MSPHEQDEKLVIITQDNCPLKLQQYIKFPPHVNKSGRGNNILHFNSSDRPYTGNKDAEKFVNEVLKSAGAIELESDSQALKFAVEKAIEYRKKDKEGYPETGAYLEFGFCSGRTINFIAALAYHAEVYGFDSGEGLPTHWRGEHFKAGTFGFTQKHVMEDGREIPLIPFVPLANVSLVVGEISQTLPLFTKKYFGNEHHIEFLHIDTDIYQSAQIIYKELENYIRPGVTVIVLDEGYNYYSDEKMKGPDEWRKHEIRATKEFAISQDYQIEYLAYNRTHQQLIIRFTS